jgi:hypothetical protein
VTYWGREGPVLLIQHVLSNFVVNTLPCIKAYGLIVVLLQVPAGAGEVWIQSVKDTEYLHC